VGYRPTGSSKDREGTTPGTNHHQQGWVLNPPPHVVGQPRPKGQGSGLVLSSLNLPTITLQFISASHYVKWIIKLMRGLGVERLIKSPVLSLIV